MEDPCPLTCDLCRKIIYDDEDIAEAQRGVVHERCLNDALDAVMKNGDDRSSPCRCQE